MNISHLNIFMVYTLNLIITNLLNFEKKDIYLASCIHLIWTGIHILDELVDEEATNDLLPLSTSIFSTVQFKLANDLKLDKKSIGLFQSDLDICFKQYDFERRKMKVSLFSKYKSFSYDYMYKRVLPFIFLISLVPSLFNSKNNFQKLIYDIFKHKMVIDQMNDDGHDWIEDLENGLLTYPVYILLSNKKTKKNNGEIYVRFILPEIVKACKKEYRAAKEKIRLLNSDYLKNITDISYKPIQLAETELKSLDKILESV